MTLRRLSRRSFLAQVSGGAFIGAGALVTLTTQAAGAQEGRSRPGSGSNARGHDFLLHVNDSDKSDRKRGVAQTVGPPRRCSDNDRGRTADRARAGRRCSPNR